MQQFMMRKILYADARFGEFYDTLKDKDFLENTNFFVIADHGEEFKEHGLWEHGGNLHHETLHIPTVAFGSMVSASGNETTPVQIFDIMPTIFDMFDLPEPYPIVGKSYYSLLSDSRHSSIKNSLNERVIISSCYNIVDQKLFVQYSAIEDGRWKLMIHYYNRAFKLSLFDLENDSD